MMTIFSSLKVTSQTFSEDEIKAMRRIIVNYEYCQMERNMLLLENEELRNGIDALVMRDSVANVRLNAISDMYEQRLLLKEEEKRLVQEKVKQRNRIIVGQSMALVLVFLTMLL